MKFRAEMNGASRVWQKPPRKVEGEEAGLWEARISLALWPS